MSIIIDGYNLLYMAGILGQGRGPRSLELSRLALLNFLAESLHPAKSQKPPWSSTPRKRLGAQKTPSIIAESRSVSPRAGPTPIA